MWDDYWSAAVTFAWVYAALAAFIIIAVWMY